MQDGSVVKGAKGRTLDTGTHVPLVAHWPGTIPVGTVCGDLIDFSDFFATFAEVAGASPPNGLVVDGRSFLPQLKGQEGDPREYLLCWYHPDWGKWEPAEFARDKTWKLYQNGKLYNVVEDPMEERPLPADAPGEAAKAREKLRDALRELP
jgi:arylsulfatase A